MWADWHGHSYPCGWSVSGPEGKSSWLAIKTAIFGGVKWSLLSFPEIKFHSIWGLTVNLYDPTGVCTAPSWVWKIYALSVQLCGSIDDRWRYCRGSRQQSWSSEHSFRRIWWIWFRKLLLTSGSLLSGLPASPTRGIHSSSVSVNGSFLLARSSALARQSTSLLDPVLQKKSEFEGE